MAGRLISRTGRASRFLTASAFANYAGAAPVEIASAEKSRHRLSRHGDRQLNSALHTIAITQIRIPSSRGHRYYKSKIAEGKHHARPHAASLDEYGIAGHGGLFVGNGEGRPRCLAT
jgi:transposase